MTAVSSNSHGLKRSNQNKQQQNRRPYVQPPKKKSFKDSFLSGDAPAAQSTSTALHHQQKSQNKRTNDRPQHMVYRSTSNIVPTPAPVQQTVNTAAVNEPVVKKVEVEASAIHQQQQSSTSQQQSFGPVVHMKGYSQVSVNPSVNFKIPVTHVSSEQRESSHSQAQQNHQDKRSREDQPQAHIRGYGKTPVTFQEGPSAVSKLDNAPALTAPSKAQTIITPTESSVDQSTNKAMNHSTNQSIVPGASATSSGEINDTNSSVYSETTFDDLDVSPKLKSQLSYLKFTKCTPVQKLAIPAIIKAHDILVRSPTGSGKTLSFCIPLLERLLSSAQHITRDAGVFAIIMSPNKELCLQTFSVLSKLTNMMPNVVIGSIAGGDNPKKEKARLRKGINIICGTPGRVLYHMENTESVMKGTSNVNMLILDEADRLLDLGFEQQIRRIHERLMSSGSRQSLQSVLVSATLSPRVQNLASWCLKPNATWLQIKLNQPLPELTAGKGSNGAESLEDVSNKKNIEGTVSFDDDDDEDAVVNVENQNFTAHVTTGADAVIEDKFELPTQLEQTVVECDLKIKLLLLFGAIFEARQKGCRKIMVFLNSCASADFHLDLSLSLTWPRPPARNNDHPEVQTTRQIKRNIAHPESYKAVRLIESDDDEEDAEGPRGEDTNTANDLIFHPSLFGFYKLHGDMQSGDRAGSLAGFTKDADKTRVLFCTDVAARGVDISQVDLVIQYDPPQQSEEYLHRAGRTARIGSKGRALLFLLPGETEYVTHIQQLCPTAVIKKVEQEALLEAFIKAYGTAKGNDRVKRLRDVGPYIMASICRFVGSQAELMPIARKAFLSSQRAYRAFSGKELRRIFDWRKLHSGHLAKNFGVEETPREIAAKNKDTQQFKKRPHNLLLRNKESKQDIADAESNPVMKSKRRRLGKSTQALSNMEFE